jgi:hypothetical protein
MRSTYHNCRNLTTAVCGPNVISMASAYGYCSNLQGNVYFYSDNIANISHCFEGRGGENRLNLYTTENSTTYKQLKITDYYSIVAHNITWNYNTTSKCYYNTTDNIYIYPVANVAAAREANGD